MTDELDPTAKTLCRAAAAVVLSGSDRGKTNSGKEVIVHIPLEAWTDLKQAVLNRAGYFGDEEEEDRADEKYDDIPF